MSDEELCILNFLQTSPETYFARKEIARKAAKRAVYEANQHWANIPLDALLAQGKIEQNNTGQYRIKADEY
jgi:hypothetical protein